MCNILSGLAWLGTSDLSSIFTKYYTIRLLFILFFSEMILNMGGNAPTQGGVMNSREDSKYSAELGVTLQI